MCVTSLTQQLFSRQAQNDILFQRNDRLLPLKVRKVWKDGFVSTKEAISWEDKIRVPLLLFITLRPFSRS